MPHASAHSGDTDESETSHSAVAPSFPLTNGSLRTRIDEGFHMVTVHFHIDVEHRDVAERLGLPRQHKRRERRTENSIACCMFSSTASIRIASSIFFWACPVSNEDFVCG